MFIRPIACLRQHMNQFLMGLTWKVTGYIPISFSLNAYQAAHHFWNFPVAQSILLLRRFSVALIHLVPASSTPVVVGVDTVERLELSVDLVHRQRPAGTNLDQNHRVASNDNHANSLLGTVLFLLNGLIQYNV